MCSGCTIEYHDQKGGRSGTDGNTFYFDDGSFDAKGYVDEIWDEELLPYALENNTDISAVIEELFKDVDSAGSLYGYRSVDQGGAWNFIVSGAGKAVSVNTESRNGLLDLDLPPYDGEADVKLQIGPVIRGTAIRDSMSFIKFDDFRNQIDFSNLATELNKKAYETVLEPLSFKAGDEITFVGAFTFSAVDDISIVPVSLTLGSLEGN